MTTFFKSPSGGSVEAVDTYTQVCSK